MQHGLSPDLFCGPPRSSLKFVKMAHKTGQELTVRALEKSIFCVYLDGSQLNQMILMQKTYSAAYINSHWLPYRMIMEWLCAVAPCGTCSALAFCYFAKQDLALGSESHFIGKI